MELLKQQIEEIYNTAVYFKETASTFASKILEAIGEDESREPRSKEQSRARWLYLTRVADILNDRGWTFEMPGFDIQFRYNKDFLYHCVWLEVKNTLYPNKKRRLNTKEFWDVANHVMDVVGMVYDIHIEFPNRESFLQQIEEQKRRTKK